MPIAASMYYAAYEGGRKDCAPVILIHGAGSSHLVWPVEMRRINGCRVYAVDLPTHGRSPGIAVRNINQYCQHLLDFFHANDIYQAVLVGHSLGGAIALQTAIDHPENVAGLGLISSAAYFSLPLRLLEMVKRGTSSPEIGQMLRADAFALNTTDEIKDLALAPFQKVRSSVLQADWEICQRFNVRSQLQDIQCPVWLAVGEEDRMVPPLSVRDTASLLPHATMQQIDQAGHMVMLEKPAALADGLKQFLQTNHWY
ncbi:MAG: alpha/beta hydrolase [Anaerolineaceae bacterium]|nr:alpha/beta hydrolase [Anaerolineaceae bacterium]